MVLIAGHFVVRSYRFTTVAGAATTGLLLIVMARDGLARPARGWFVFGVAALVAGRWTVAYQPLPSAAPTLPVGVLPPAVLGCVGGLALAGRGRDHRPTI